MEHSEKHEGPELPLVVDGARVLARSLESGELLMMDLVEEFGKKLSMGEVDKLIAIGSALEREKTIRARVRN